MTKRPLLPHASIKLGRINANFAHGEQNQPKDARFIGVKPRLAL